MDVNEKDKQDVGTDRGSKDGDKMWQDHVLGVFKVINIVSSNNIYSR